MPHVPYHPTYHFRFAGFEFREKSGELMRDGQVLSLPNQAGKVLLALLRAQGQIVTREEMRQVLWPDKVSGDFEGGINVAMRKLRKVLDDEGVNPVLIGTLPTHGYRLLVPVQSLEDPLPTSTPSGSAPRPSAELQGSPPASRDWSPGAVRLLASGLERFGQTHGVLYIGILAVILGVAGLAYWTLGRAEITPGSRPGELLRDKVSGIEFVWIPAGTFTMGSPASEEGHQSDEGPQHEVEISRGFWMGRCEVTQGQYTAVMGTNPAGFKQIGLQGPVENVSWNDAQAFVQKLNEVGGTGQIYRLPTEAEWEYACRAGTTGRTYGPLNQISWNLDNALIMVGNDNFEFRPHPVGQKQPNAWGLYDMIGNVWEWCQDCYSANPYPSSLVTDPTGINFSPTRVYRGGACSGNIRGLRAAYRGNFPPDTRYATIGFRIVCTPR